MHPFGQERSPPSRLHPSNALIHLTYTRCSRPEVWELLVSILLTILGKNKVKVSRYLPAGAKEERIELLFILDLGTPQPRFIHGNGPWYVLDMRLGGPQSWSGHRD
jgi:hypothetical protein